MAGGDLEGIRQGLEYLSDLGIGAFYTTPLFRSSSNHKYNTADYRRVDPAFGTNEGLARLVRDSHARGIRVVLDAVFNHSGTDFFAFRDVRRRGAAAPDASSVHTNDTIPGVPAKPNNKTFSTGLGDKPNRSQTTRLLPPGWATCRS
jgi:glycosidase